MTARLGRKTASSPTATAPSPDAGQGGTRHPFCRTPGDRRPLSCEFSQISQGGILEKSPDLRQRFGFVCPVRPPILQRSFAKSCNSMTSPKWQRNSAPSAARKSPTTWDDLAASARNAAAGTGGKPIRNLRSHDHPPYTPIAAVPADSRLPPMATATASIAAVLATCKTATTNRKELKSCKHQPYTGKPSHWLPDLV